MPADTPLYVEATVRPEGEQAENLDALLAELGELPLVGLGRRPGRPLDQRSSSPRRPLPVWTSPTRRTSSRGSARRPAFGIYDPNGAED